MLNAVMATVVNPVLETVLASPLHRMVSGGLCVLRYEGRRTGRRISVVVQYAQPDDATVVVFAGRPDTKVWWRNFEEPRVAAVLLRGRTSSATGRIVTDGEPWQRALAAYAERYPRWTKGIKPGEPFVVLDLHPQPTPDSGP